MFTKNQLNTLEERHTQITLDLVEKRYMYLGILNEYQIHAKDLKQVVIYTKLNPHQHLLFKRVLHGTNIYTSEQLLKMHWDKKRRIKKVWKRAQKELNAWKQLICNKSANQIFKVFDNSTFAKDVQEVPVNEIDDQYINKISFKELNIKYEDIILFFMGKGLLPTNYFDLK
tara:strand:+ start:1618 stop:2130 length:513 start_codon:yes stop_codon:yes gene_type:complete